MIEKQVSVETRELVYSRLIPFSGTSITATTEGAAQTFATANAQGAMQVERLAIVNTTGTAATVSLQAGGVDQLSEYSIAANDAVDLTEAIGGFYVNGTDLTVWSDTNGALTISGYWRDLF